jgi:acyl-CoA synthetase (AMP-forming)/AMP-acid ligase II
MVDRSTEQTAMGIVNCVPSLKLLLTLSGETPAIATGRMRVQTWDEALASPPAPAPRVIDVDLATIIYTSGSTGTPKGVMSTHANVIAAVTSINSYLGNTRADVILDALPLSFDYGLYQIFLAFQVGACVVIEKAFMYPAQIVQRLRDERVTGFPAVPTIFSLLLEHRRSPVDLPHLRYVTNTAATLPPAHIERIRCTFPGARLYSMYGLTECKRVSYLPPEELDRRPGSVGIPIPNSAVLVVDEGGRQVPPGEAGELVVRGSHVMRGYWNDPVETAKRFRPGPIAGETVLYTGDLVSMDAEGFLYFVGRKDDIIKCRGEKVSPKEVEAVVFGLDRVVDAAVFGVPDAILGEAVILVVALSSPNALSSRDIRLHCQKHLEDFMVPKAVHIWPELPKTAAGKIDKRAIRACIVGLKSGSTVHAAG